MSIRSLSPAFLAFLLVAGCGSPGDDIGLVDSGPGDDGGGLDAGTDSGPPPNPCGNGAIDGGEQCDDGNLTTNDGCDASCQIEPGGTCMDDGMGNPLPGACIRCSNGILEAGEVCDDANLNDGDGCSSTCTLEPGAACNDDPMAPECWFCGDNVVDTDRVLATGPDAEVCDDGGECSGASEGMGASAAGTGCVVGNSTACNSFPADCAPIAGDGCDENCHLEAGWDCTVTMTTDAMGNPISIGGACSRCGDGVREETEQCDTGGQCSGASIGSAAMGTTCMVGDASACGGFPADCGPVAGDGCLADCSDFEDPIRWICATDMAGLTTCSLCGDGVADGSGAQCDDGGECDGGNAGMGASAVGTACTVDDMVACNGFPQDCFAVAGDGCSAQCVEEPGWSCDPSGGSCSSCGDGVVSGSEACDDGGRCTDTGLACLIGDMAACGGDAALCTLRNADGCDSSCNLELGWSCDAATPNVCGRCGDGAIQAAAGENCDDRGQCSGASMGSSPAGTVCVVGDAAGCGGFPLDCAPVAGDGCDASCVEEMGWTCIPQAGGTVCQRCGDGILQGTEQCDDVVGTPVDGDGCSATCTIEASHSCDLMAVPTVCYACGDGVMDPTEACDDGNLAANDGCNSACQVESAAGWVCVQDSTGTSVCSDCGNGVVEQSVDGMTVLGETCDDGQDGDDADGCLDTCQTDTAGGWECAFNAGTGGFTGCKLCGNGAVELDEECDTGALGVDDGCTDSCAVDTAGGWICQTDGMGGTLCASCGDGTVQMPIEACDLGVLGVDDGCTDACQVDGANGWSCDVGGTSCELCGDGNVDGSLGELCDDGNRLSGDGCDLNCQVEVGSGWQCTEDSVTGESVCSNCGNGILEMVLDSDGMTVLGETCDDRNTVDTLDTDGCISCQIDTASGWECTTRPSGMLTLHESCFKCGNGLLESGEACDDGGTMDGDGCSGNSDPDPANHCQVEAGGWSCQNTGVFPSPISVCANCGDGTLQAPQEECDLGALGVDDGCTDTCQVDGSNGWSCNMAGDACANCGDGVLDAAFGEQCDDGARFSGDGCRFDCQLEADWVCRVDGMDNHLGCSKCGNGVVETGETCDDRNAVSADGCAGTELVDTGTWCQEEAGYQCHLAGFACAQCGMLPREIGEACEDGNTMAGDGCDARCQLEPGNFDCSAVGMDCTLCGDGVAEGNEECDDAFGTFCADGSPCDPSDGGACSDNPSECTPSADDGCGSTCLVEDGYNCDAMGSCSAAGCGDGVVAGAEECDDGADPNTGLPVPGDGCSVICTIEDGYVCVAGACRLTVCGDGVLEGDELCDDGNMTPGDGCSSCVVDAGYACPTEGALCVTGLCGNSVVDAGEECDDAFDSTDTYCEQCKLLSGGYCPTDGVDCDVMMGDCDCVAEVCGNGMRRGLEECDDIAGTPVDGDGCSAGCTVEPLWRCSEDAMLLSTCEPVAEFVEVLQFNVSSVSANGIYYDPRTRSFGAYKVNPSQDPIELCLDGSVIDPSNTTAGPGGTVFLPDGSTSAWTGGFRPRQPGSKTDGAAYNQFDGTIHFLQADANSSTLHTAPAASFDRVSMSTSFGFAVASALISDRGDDIASGSFSLVGEDGRLYIAENDTRRWCNGDDTVVCTGNAGCAGSGGTCVTGARIFIFEPDASCDGSLGNAPGVDCSGFVQSGNDLIASDSFGVDSGAGGNALDVGYVIPGASIFATAFEVGDVATTCPLTGGGCSQYHFYQYGAALDTATGYTEIFASSTVPGTLFVDTSATQAPGEFPLDTVLAGNNPADGSETATDGGAFVVCSSNPSDACRLYSRGCATDADCAAVSPGSICFDPGGGAVPYCRLEGQARDDRYSFTLDGTPPEILDVLANDVLSENVCADRRVGIRSLSTADTDLQGRLNVVGECSGDASPCSFDYADVIGGTIDANCSGSGDGDICLGLEVEWSYPAVCGTLETFDYDALLGGGEIDSATVRITPECDCGDGSTAPSEQCDWSDPVFGTDRCNPDCTLNVVCGDSITDVGEECDDGATCADGMTVCDPRQSTACASNPIECTAKGGDGCGATCVAEFQCGNMVVELGEQCDDGGLVNEDGCSSTCQIEDCGDGIVQAGLGEECEPPGVGGCDGFCANEPVCGDSQTEGTEACDDGGICDDDGITICAVGLTSCPMGGNCLPASNDGCDASCEPEYCGDGVVQPGLGEACDFALTPATCSFSCEIVTCGDGVISGSEQCDDNNVTSEDGCSATCLNEYCGDGIWQSDPMGLAEGCDDGNNFNGDGCNSSCVVEYCGDNVINHDDAQMAVDECDDGGNVDGDGCSATCLAEYCGDGTTQAGLGEECEPGDFDMGTGATCQANCLWGNVCGDSTVGGDEQCDDGNATACGDTCTNDCRVASCGDGIIECGEECDGNDPDCTLMCVIDRCGNGTLDLGDGEECDDGNTTAGDGCDAACQDEWVCGDGDVDPGEACDPNDMASAVHPVTGSPCRGSDCTYEPICGDNSINVDYLTSITDECDDGNTVSDDGCSATCRNEYCGDGVVQASEDCELGDMNCSAVCTFLAFCGNGSIDAGEECDDGNTSSEDGCSGDSCQDEYCGDGVVQGGLGETCEPPTMNCDLITCTVNQVCGNGMVEGSEECDDSNLVSGDGCSGTCVDEFCGDGIRQTGIGESCDDGMQCTNGVDCTGNPAACAGLGDQSCAPRSQDGCSDTCGIEIG